MVDVVTNEVLVDANPIFTLESISTSSTFVFESCDHKAEAILVGSPRVRDVFQRDEVGTRVDDTTGAEGVDCFFARQIGLVCSDGMCSIIDEKFVVAVHVKFFKAEHEPLQDGFGLKCNHTINVPFIVRDHDGAINGFGDFGEEALVTTLTKGVDWKKFILKGACERET